MLHPPRLLRPAALAAACLLAAPAAAEEAVELAPPANAPALPAADPTSEQPGVFRSVLRTSPAAAGPLLAPPSGMPEPAPELLPPPAPLAPPYPDGLTPSGAEEEEEPWSEDDLPLEADLDLEALSLRLEALAREHLPPVYEDDDKWGKQGLRWNGLHVELRGLQIDTHRRFSKVNHGVWEYYRVEVRDPAQDFHLRVTSVELQDDGRLRVQLESSARLHLLARRARWVKGVQLFALSAEADAEVGLHAECELGLKLDITRIPPDIGLDLDVESLDFDLHDFQLHRVSQVGGEPVQQLGEAAEDWLGRELDRRKPDLLRKANEVIDKQEARLRFSPSELWRKPEETPPADEAASP